MALTLLAGPANSGKVAALLERYLRLLERDPVLIVPNRSDVDRIERDLLRRSPALMGGSIGTFDDVFRGIAERPHALVALSRVRRLARRDPGRARVGARRPLRPRARGSCCPLRRIPRGARPPRPVGPRPRAPSRGRAAVLGARGMGRQAGLRLRV